MNDWISSFSSPNSPLTKKLLNEFQTQLYIAKPKHRGYTTINSITIHNSKDELQFDREDDAIDILRIQLNSPLRPHDSVTIEMDYVLNIQSDRFTGYGVTKHGEYLLNSWYFTPCVLEDDQWRKYSNYSFDDLWSGVSEVSLSLNIPKSLFPHTALITKNTKEQNDRVIYNFEGQNVISHKLFLTSNRFKSFKVDDIELQTDIAHKKIDTAQEQKYFEKVFQFLKDNLGVEPHKKIILSNTELKKNSLYGLALLPDIISPFEKEFEYELVIAKNIIKQYLDQQLNIDPRQDYWLKNGFQMLLFMHYIDTFYPEQRLMGKLSKIWGLRHFNFSKLNYNAQYKLTYQQMMRRGRDQALKLPREKLLNFNERFTSYYKSAISLTYLNDYVEMGKPITWIREFLNQQQRSYSTTTDFRQFVERKTTKNLDWFFDDFLTQYYSADYKISAIEKKEDSIEISIKNLRQGAYPFTLTSQTSDLEISSQWIEGFKDEMTISIPNSNARLFVLNKDNKTPEFNLKNNTKVSDKRFSLNKPLQFRLFRDVENPKFNQLYLIPIAEFQNVYDGIKIGMNFNNQGILAKPIVYAIAPTYGTLSKTLTGYAKFVYDKYHESGPLYQSKYGLTLDRSSFNYGDFITKFQPFAQFTFLDANNLRSNSLQQFTLRYINIKKDNSKSILDSNEIPPYDVFNVRYLSLKNDIEDYKRWHLDLQLSKQFGKFNMSYEIRKRTPKDRHYNLRLFGGLFIYNSLPNSETNFSYALDRPTDYLFDYNYLGQSESTGFLSQQLIVADGGFKSRLEPAFANRWMTTINASASIWRYVQAYGDIGLIKNNGKNIFFGYDSGIRVDLVTDYFELYFPVYSNLGWEISQPSYADKIRFVITTDLTRLGSLLTRRWF